MYTVHFYTRKRGTMLFLFTVDYDELIDYGEENENARPELAEQVTGMENYDVVFLGFPKMQYCL